MQEIRDLYIIGCLETNYSAIKLGKNILYFNALMSPFAYQKMLDLALINPSSQDQF